MKNLRLFSLLFGCNFHHRMAIGFVDDPVAHQTHVVEIARYVLNDLDVIVRTVGFLVIEWLDRHAVPVLEQRIEQRAVRIAA